MHSLDGPQSRDLTLRVAASRLANGELRATYAAARVRRPRCLARTRVTRVPRCDGVFQLILEGPSALAAPLMACSPLQSARPFWGIVR